MTTDIASVRESVTIVLRWRGSFGDEVRPDDRRDGNAHNPPVVYSSDRLNPSRPVNQGTGMKPLVFVALLALAFAAPDAPETVAWRNGSWFDGTGFRQVEVYSEGGRLTLRTPPSITRSVDLGGRFITGAFGEAHNHNIPSGDVAQTIRTYLDQGIFYVMIQTNVPGAPAALRDRINRPDSVDVIFANGSFTAPGGHPTALVRRNIANGGMTTEDLDGGFLHPVPTTDDIDRVWWTRIKKQRPDFIKLTLVYSEDRVAKVPVPAASDRYGLDPGLARHLVKKAHDDGLRASAHVESAYDFDVAIAAGADLVAHIPGFWPDGERIKARGAGIYRISEEAARRAGRQGTIVMTTVGEVLRMNLQADARAQVVDVLRWNFDLLKRHGVRLAIGSDQFRSTSVPEAVSIAREGLMTNAEVVHALSVVTPAAIFPGRAPFGFAEGAPANFIALEANPLEDINALSRVVIRVKDGRELRVVSEPTAIR